MNSNQEPTSHRRSNCVMRKLFYLKIRCILLFNKAILVHFSGLGNGSTNYYPDDLLYATSNTNEPRCASSVTLSMIHNGHRLWGEVGLILVPSNANSVIAVKKSDAGSTVINGKVIVECADKNFSVETCLQAVTRDSGHDEWILAPFVVKCLLPVVSLRFAVRRETRISTAWMTCLIF